MTCVETEKMKMIDFFWKINRNRVSLWNEQAKSLIAESSASFVSGSEINQTCGVDTPA